MCKVKGSERGQVLILAVFAMVGLIAALGLAIDGGTVMLERRRMQNAADAGALAGTRVLAQAVCGGPDADDGAVESAVEDYVTRNGADGFSAEYVWMTAGSGAASFVPARTVGGGSIPEGASGISVTVEIQRPTYFISVVGIDTGGAAGQALAVTGPSRTLEMGLLRPFGIPESALDDLEDGVTIGFGLCRGEAPDCYVKNPDGDTLAQHRGWMNLGYVFNAFEDDEFPRAVDKSGDANVLKQWMASGKPLSLYPDDYIHAVPGAMASVVKEAGGLVDSGETIFIPVYDHIVPFAEIETAKPQDGGPQGANYHYHIVGFAAVRVTAANQGKKEVTVEQASYTTGSGRLLPTEMDGQGYEETQACETGIQLVRLWR